MIEFIFYGVVLVVLLVIVSAPFRKGPYRDDESF